MYQMSMQVSTSKIQTHLIVRGGITDAKKKLSKTLIPAFFPGRCANWMLQA